jgi:hypothetical protein
MTEQVVEVDEPVLLTAEECNKVLEEKTIFVVDDVYKSVEMFKEQLPNLPEYVYWILFLRYNKNIISADEINFAEETISRLKKELREENSYFQKLFEDNKVNTIDCTPLADLPAENELVGIGFN